MNKVLIVDDDADILESLSLILETEGYKVTTTTKGLETIILTKKFLPDVILLDLLLSGISGSDICKNLKKEKLLKSIPVIMMSAHPSALNIIKECHAEAFISKPFDIDVLLNKIKSQIH